MAVMLQTRTGGAPHAVVDIGSNSVRLVVYDHLGRAPLPLFDEKSLCGLGDGLPESGVLAEEAITKTLQALHRYTAIARGMGAGRIDIIATEAVRRAQNGMKLVRAIKARTGLWTHVLSGEQEARFAAFGVIAGFHRPQGLVGDLGGGSLDLADVQGDQVGIERTSMPIGVLPIALAMNEAGASAKRRIDDLLVRNLDRFSAFPVFYAVGGGWRALARVHMAMTDARVKIAHGYVIDGDQARAFVRTIRRLDQAAIEDLPKLPARRAKTIKASALIMDRVLKRLRPERVVFSASGVREGWLYDQLSETDRARDPLMERARSFALQHPRGSAFGTALVRWTDGLLASETDGERRLRVAAAILSDIAWSEHASLRARTSFERLLQLPLVGIDQTERVYLAAIIHARYDGKSDDPVLSPAIGLLSEGTCHRARILGRSMLLAHRLSASVPDILDSSTIKIERDRVCLEVSATDGAPESEAVRRRLRSLTKAIGARRSEIVKVDSFARGQS